MTDAITPPRTPRRQMTESRDYLAFQMKPADIPLSDKQKDEARRYLTRNPDVAPVLNPFVRRPPEERDRIIRSALRQCIADGVVAQAAEPGKQHLYKTPDDALINALYAQVVGLDVLETLLQDDDVSSITVINENSILYEKSGRTYVHSSGFESRDRMIEVIKNLAIRGGQQLTPAAPTADLAFPPPQVVRIHLSIDPVTPRFGGFMALRRGRAVAWTLEKLVTKGVMDDDVADFIRAMMKIPASVIVGGEPSSGKTTLLEVMISMMEGQHVCVLEQAAELNPTNRLLSYFEVPPTSDTISLATLTIDSLRKNAQVVIIGETRGSETGWLLFIAGAMKAIMTTLHGRNSRQVVERLATNAQIQGDPPSPFIGNKELAKQAVANAFDFVIHCTQLPDGRRVVSAIDHVTGVQGEVITLDTVVKAVVDVVDEIGGRKQLHVRWDWSPAWQSGGDNERRWKMPDDLDFHLRMAEVRNEVAHEESGTAGARQHEKYQRACYALDQTGFAQASQLFAELLQASPTGYLDTETRLRRALQGLGRWDTLLKQADRVEQQLNSMVRRRQWGLLAQGLRELDSSVELRVALSNQVEMKKYTQVLGQGQRWENDWATARRSAASLMSRGEPEKAAAALRRVNVTGLNDDLRHEVRRLRLDALQAWLQQQPRGDKAAAIYHEMFALADENSEPGLLTNIAQNIRRLEGKTGGAAVDVGQMNVAVFTHPSDAVRKTTAGGDSQEQARHELYLRGVVAMQENRWAAALEHFRQIQDYRQAGVFIKSLEALQQGMSNGTDTGVAAQD